MKSRPDLIVPIRDRRQHRRVLTLKNFSYVAVASIMFFAGLTIQSNLRRPDKNSNYGRLLGKQVSGQAAVEPKKAEIAATPIEDQTSADPLLVQPAQRAGWLGVDPVTTSTAFPTDTAGSSPTGIVITRKTPQPSQPTLSGGIFRQ